MSTQETGLLFVFTVHKKTTGARSSIKNYFYWIFIQHLLSNEIIGGLLRTMKLPTETVSFLEMTMDKNTQDDAQHSNMVKDPENWTTGDEPMTGAQKSYLQHYVKKPARKWTTR